MLLKSRGRILLLVFIGVIFLAGAYLMETYFTGSELEPTAQAYTGQNNYTVKQGDSLYAIAKKYGVKVKDIQQSNYLKSDLIIPGHVLTIPDKTGSNLYTVRNGDSLYIIAQKYGITVTTLKQANKLKSDLINPGQVLTIPTGSGNTMPPVENKPVPEEPPLSNTAKPLATILKENGVNDPWSQMSIAVNKSAHTLSLVAGNVWLKTYTIDIGDAGLGDKTVQGDHKTPEGTFYISEKSVLTPEDEFLGTRWLRLSYPNMEDAKRGLNQGIIAQATYNQIVKANQNKSIPPQYTPLGGGVGIHGGTKPELGDDWTWGCVGLRNNDVEEFFNYVTVGTKVVIRQ